MKNKPSKMSQEIAETVIDLLNHHLDEDEEPLAWGSPAGKATVDAYTRELLVLFSTAVDDIVGEGINESTEGWVDAVYYHREALRKQQRQRKTRWFDE